MYYNTYEGLDSQCDRKTVPAIIIKAIKKTTMQISKVGNYSVLVDKI